MNKEIDKNKLQRYLSGHYTENDRRYVEQLFARREYSAELKKYLAEDWEEICSRKMLPEHNMNHILQKILAGINSAPQAKPSLAGRLWSTYSKIAAVLFIPMLIGYGLYHYSNYRSGSSDQYRQSHSVASIHAPLGARINFTLPDGSTGWLNSGSYLRYPVAFGRIRQVELVGEGYFDIIKDEERPFEVKTGDMIISVLGTRFNLSAYDDDDRLDLVLESGKVRLYDMQMKKYIELKPNERVIYQKKEHKVLSKTTVDASKFSSWKEGKLEFRNDTMEEVVKRLSRWYNVDIVLVNPAGNSINNLRLRATFEDEDIEEVMRLLKLSLPVDYEIAQRQKDQKGEFGKKKIKIYVK